MSDVYRRRMYELSELLERGDITWEDYMRDLDSYVTPQERPVLAVPGLYPHHLLRQPREARRSYHWMKVILFLPRAAIQWLVNVGYVPSQETLREDWESVLSSACRNPDPGRSVLRYLVESGTVAFERAPDYLWLFDAHTEDAVRFLLERGCTCANIEMDVQLDAYREPGAKAGIIRALLEHGAVFSLRGFYWMDLSTWRVLEEHISKDRLCEWIGRSRASILDNFSDLWPCLMQEYGLCFSEEECRCALWARTDMEFVLDEGGDALEEEHIHSETEITARWVQDRTSHRHATREFYACLGALLNYNANVSFVILGSDLSQLDPYLIWSPRTARFYSASLRGRLFVLLCAVRRLCGTTLWFKPLLPPVVRSMALHPPALPVTGEKKSDGWCATQ